MKWPGLSASQRQLGSQYAHSVWPSSTQHQPTASPTLAAHPAAAGAVVEPPHDTHGRASCVRVHPSSIIAPARPWAEPGDWAR